MSAHDERDTLLPPRQDFTTDGFVATELYDQTRHWRIEGETLGQGSCGVERESLALEFFRDRFSSESGVILYDYCSLTHSHSHSLRTPLLSVNLQGQLTLRRRHRDVCMLASSIRFRQRALTTILVKVKTSVVCEKQAKSLKTCKQMRFHFYFNIYNRVREENLRSLS